MFIHDDTPNPNKTWRSRELNEEWPIALSRAFPSARVLIYQYERSWVRNLSDIVSPDHLHKITGQLLEFLENEDDNSTLPIVFFAHGLGGLLYEQVRTACLL